MARNKSQAASPAISINGPESGATGLKQYSGYVREEWLRDLQGRVGMQMYREMLDNHPIIGAIMFAVTMLLRGVQFSMEGDSDNSDDQAAADFVDSCIGDMEHSWADFVAVALSFLGYGWDVHEIVYKMRQGPSTDPDEPGKASKYTDGMIGWRKFAHRGQETLLKWDFNKNGDATALHQLLPTAGPNGSTQCVVPLVKCLHFTTTRLKANPEGKSIIRNAYTSYFYQKRLQELEVNGAERDLTGIPIAWIPPKLFDPNASPADKAAYAMWKKLARDTYRNEQEGFVLPQSFDDKGNKLYDFTLLTTAGRRQFDIGASIERLDQRMAQVALADFITLGGQGSTGSYAQSRNKTDMFTIACKAWLDLVCDVINRKAIPDLLSANGLKGKCHMMHGDIARRDLTELEQYIAGLVTAGVIMPDDVLEEHVREEADLPSADQDTLRSTMGGGDGTSDPAGGTPKPGAPNPRQPANKAPVAKRRRITKRRVG